MGAAANVPILHIGVAAAAEVRRLEIAPGRVGVMGPQATLNMRLYQDRLAKDGWTCIVPEQDQMDRLVSPAIALVKANRVADAFALLASVARGLSQRGATAVVLGCTEIPLGLQAGPRLEIPVVD